MKRYFFVVESDEGDISNGIWVAGWFQTPVKTLELITKEMTARHQHEVVITAFNRIR